MRLVVVIGLTLLLIIESDLKRPKPEWELEEPEIDIFNCLIYKGKTFYKNLDEIRSRYRSRRVRIRHEDHFKNCKDAKNKAKLDSKKGGFRIIRFNGIGGKFPKKDVLYEKLLGVEIVNTGCYLYSWSECYNEEMENQLRNKYDPNILELITELDSLLFKKVLIDISKRTLMQVNSLPNMGIEVSKFQKEVSKIKCLNDILYMLFEVEVLKNGKTGKVIKKGGNPDRICEGELKNLIKGYEDWQPAMKSGKPFDTVINLQLFF